MAEKQYFMAKTFSIDRVFVRQAYTFVNSAIFQQIKQLKNNKI